MAEEAAFERGELGGVEGGRAKVLGRVGAASGAATLSAPRSQLQGSYTEAEIPRSSRRRARPREVLVVLVGSLRLVEDSAREKESERRRGVHEGVQEGVGGAEKGTGEEMGDAAPLQVLLRQEA